MKRIGPSLSGFALIMEQKSEPLWRGHCECSSTPSDRFLIILNQCSDVNYVDESIACIMNIEGFWTGEYAYDAVKALKVEFHAELSQVGAILSGNTTEQNTFGNQGDQILIAALFGKVSSQNVSFTKNYRNGPPNQKKIFYQGSISNDGSLITGTWTMMSMWSGSFRMTRAVEQKPKAQIVTANETENA